MVFVLGCLIVIAIILALSYGLEADRQSLSQESVPIPQSARPPATKIPEKSLIVTIKTRNADFITQSPSREFRYPDLKGRFLKVDGGHGYSGTALAEILNLTTPHFQKIVAYDEAGQPHDIGKDASDWMIAIDRSDKPLPPEEGGPYILLNRQNPLKHVLRVARIEAV